METAQAQPAMEDEPATRGRLLVLAGVAVVTGAAAGLLGAGFRLALLHADKYRASFLTWAHAHGPSGLAIVLGVCAAATALAAFLVRRFAPLASGSGIPHVECVLKGEIKPVPFELIPVKFIGGVLAMGAGLALGREGPSVQMGASAGHLLGRLFRRGSQDTLVLLAAGAGAGLATAFNAPIAGAVFVLEELVRRFDTRITVATLGASAGAIAVSRIFLGESPDFVVLLLRDTGSWSLLFYVALGVAAGLAGVAYNRTILGTMTLAERFRGVPVELFAGAMGAIAGLVAWYSPELVGGGDHLTQSALSGATPSGGSPLTLLFLIFLFRFAMGPLSYAARTPGGLFAPLLVLGAQGGLLLGTLSTRWFPAVVPDPRALAVVGMAAFFTAVVRAPVTGIVLVMEMTGSSSLLLPMLVACCTAMAVPTLLGNLPIYDSLRERTLAAARALRV